MMIRIEDLTVGERLAVARDRRGMTQREFAEFLKVTRRRLQELEAGTAKAVERDMTVAVVVGLVTDLKLHEQCAVARSRAGMRVSDVARALGRSRQWVYEMESGRENCQELATFWGIEAAA